MARAHEYVYALNAGGVDRLALSRIDLEKMRLAGEHPVANWQVSVLGPMSVRPGLESLQALPALTRPIPFIRDGTTTALIGFSNETVTIYGVDGTPVQVVNSASTVVNPTFLSGGGGWTDVSDTGAGTDGVVTLGVSGDALFLATRWRAAALQQSISIALNDRSLRHTLRIEVDRGPVFFRVGSTAGGEEVFTETRLITGVHKLSFTPNTATIYIQFRSEDPVFRVLGRCQFEHTLLGGAGNLTLAAPWLAVDLPVIAVDQSRDVMFIGDRIYQQRRLERRGEHSWSLTLYQTRNGPFQFPETTKISLTPSARSENGVLTSSVPYFKASHVGTLFELTHPEQQIADELHAIEQTTDKITIRGLFSSTKVYNDRDFGYSLDFTTGAFVGTIALESSTDPDGDVWVQTKTFTAGATATYNDEQSNLLVHYRFRVVAYTSGYATVSLTYLAGSSTGQARITDYTSSTSVLYEVVKPIGGISATRSWRGPKWSSDLGWPRVPCFRDDRLHWFRNDRNFASIVDDYDNFDDSREGDSGPIDRTVGNGPAEGVRWAVDIDRLVVGTSGFTAAIQASDFNEVVTPTSYTVRIGPTIGSSYVPPVQVDDILIMTDRSERRLYDVQIPEGSSKLKSTDVTRLNPRAVRAGVKAMAVQRKPDTRAYIVLDDGACVVLTYDRDDKVVAYTTLDTDGDFVDVAVLPATNQDNVYFVVLRSNVYYLERLATEADQEATSTCILLDASKVLTGSLSTITGGTHLANRTVHVWADGFYRGTTALDGSGNGPVPAAGGGFPYAAPYARVVYGLSYDASFTSVKLAYAAQLGTAVGQTKIVRRAGLILANSVLDGIRVGRDISLVDSLPDYLDGALRTQGQFVTHYDEDLLPIQSDWDTDARIFVGTSSHFGPVTVQAIVLDVETRDGARQA